MKHGIRLIKDQPLSNEEELERMSQVPYASVIGSIMYFMTCTRPDISYALSMVNWYKDNVGDSHY